MSNVENNVQINMVKMLTCPDMEPRPQLKMPVKKCKKEKTKNVIQDIEPPCSITDLTMDEISKLTESVKKKSGGGEEGVDSAYLSFEKRNLQDIFQHEEAVARSLKTIRNIKPVSQDVFEKFSNPKAEESKNLFGLPKHWQNWLENNRFQIAMLLVAIIISISLGFSANFFIILVALLILAQMFSKNLYPLWEVGVRITEFVKNEIATLYGTPPTVKKSESEKVKEQVEFSLNDAYADQGIINYDPSEGENTGTNYNYKVKVKINEDDFIFAEIDTDSHISIISETYFNRISALSEIEYLSEEPLTFHGLGSTASSKYSPVVLTVQIGRIRMKGRFIVTNLLQSSPILLGTDFLMKNKVSVAPWSDREWFVTIGALDKPLGKVPAYITNRISLYCSKSSVFKPFEIKKVSVSANLNGSSRELFLKNHCHKTVKSCSHINDSPFRLFEDEAGDDSSLIIQNLSPVTVTMQEGLELAETNVDLTSFQVANPAKTQNFNLETTEGGDAVLNSAELENLLEPGFLPSGVIDKESELDFIRNHKTFPEEFKGEFLKFLEARPELFSGEEFSKQHFPPQVYTHDVELIEKISHMSSRPFPVSGIRLQQLKEDINELVKNGVLSPGDSSFTSPCFYVLKKASEGKSASKGRLCFDYRKLNSLIKSKNFPISTSKNFFDGASKFKFFCVLDIKNAFLSIPLTERARKLCAIITPFGTFLPNRTPYGLKTSPSAFCFALYQVIGDLDFIHFYMDDIHVGGETKEELFKNLMLVMDRLFRFNLKIQLSKTKFFVKETKILGVIYSSVGKKIDPEKVKAIEEFGEIDSLKKTQSFLGMLAFLGSFIPHFSTACAPLYALLKNQKEKKFELTVEAMEAYKAIKSYISKTTMLYHPDFEKAFYLATDASNLAAGSFLYQIEAYEKTEQGKAKMLDDLGFECEQGGGEWHMLPGVSPGKNAPVVTTFLKDPEKLKKFDKLNTLSNEFTMTEKIKNLSSKYLLHVRPIAFYSKTFTESQVASYATMEKEFLALMLSVKNFRDYLEAAPVTFILTDSQPLCWALKHREDQLKLSRWILKLYEYRIEFIVCHISGEKNGVADFLSRLYYVHDSKSTSEIGPKQAQHVNSPFSPFQVLTKEDVLAGFSGEMVVPCVAPDLCHLNVNSFLYKNLGPFAYTYNCLEKEVEVKKLLTNESFGFTPKSLEKYLTLKNVLKEQNLDEELKIIILSIENEEKILGNFFLQKGILCKSFREVDRPDAIVVPKRLVPFVLASFHFMSHAGPEKSLELIQLKYFWRNMMKDIRAFSQSCSLCQIYKNSNKGPQEIGSPRVVLEAGKFWQIDICSGLPTVNKYKSFLTIIDLYTGFVIPVPLKVETSEEISKAVDTYLIKIFGPPEEISSDNAANLSGPEMRKLCAFYNIKYRKTVPYSPTSHALVENANRYVTELLRIFSDQFQTYWPDLMSIAALVFNSVPRPQLSGHSPFFLMFQREPFSSNEFQKIDENNLDLEDFVKRAMNERGYAKLLREKLLLIREKRNTAKNQPYRSYPKGSLVLVKDLRPRVHKKIKPVFFKIPEKVVTEYRCTVYTSDIFGRIRKHSKNNIRMMSKRSFELFSSLPEDIKLILGDPLDEDTWEEIKNSGNVPAYFADIEISSELGVKTRQQIAQDTHLVEDSPPLNPENNTKDSGEGEEEDELDQLVSDETTLKLNKLYDAEMLGDPKLTLKDIPDLFEKLTPANDLAGVNNSQNKAPFDDENEMLEDVGGTPVNNSRDPGGINIENILPERTRRRVRFNIPQLTSKN